MSVAAATEARSPLQRLLAPRRVGIVGSLSAPTRPGARTAAHLHGAGFEGEVRCASRVAELLENHDSAGHDSARHDSERRARFDVVCLAVPAAAVPAALEELDGHTANVVVYSSGFSEADGGDLRRFDRPGTRLLGPNTVGLYHAANRLPLTFAAVFDDLLACRSGSGAWLLAHSGALGARLVSAATGRGLHLDGFIAPGNEDGYTMAELIVGLVDGPDPTTLIALYIEGVADAPPLLAALDHARRRGVAVICLVGGRSSVGADAAASHTAAVSSGGAALADVLALHGAHVVASELELVDAAVALATNPTAPGPGVTIVTGSGGAGVICADLLAARGVDLPAPSPAAAALLADRLPEFASVANPVDVTAAAIADDERMAAVIDAVLDDAASSAHPGGVVLAVMRRGQADWLAAASRRASVPVVVALMDGGETTTADHVAAGRCVLASLLQGVHAAAALSALSGNAVADRAVPIETTTQGAQRSAEVARFLDGDPPWTVENAARLVVLAGLPAPASQMATTAADAVAVGDRLGWPVVLKGNVSSSEHKAAVGAVALDVTSDDIERRAADMIAAFGAVVVAEQLRGGVELLVSARVDTGLGTVATVGLGGGAVELIDRTVTLSLDVDDDELVAVVTRRIFADDAGRRGCAAALVGAARLLAAASEQANGALIECNPVIETDRGLVALDARVVPRD